MTIRECMALANGKSCPSCNAPVSERNVFYSEDRERGVRPTDAGRNLSFSVKCPSCHRIAGYEKAGIRILAGKARAA